MYLSYNCRIIYNFAAQTTVFIIGKRKRDIIRRSSTDNSMKKYFLLQLVLLLSLRVLADPTYTTKEVPVNRGGQDGGTVTLRFYEDMPTVPYIEVNAFQGLMLPGSTITVTKTGVGEYLLKGPHAEATVNTTTDVFTSDDYMGFTNLMGQMQEGMANVYYDGAPYVRYSSQELTPASVTVTFDFRKYGIDLRGDDDTVYFPLATLSDIFSDLYYHVAGYNGERVNVVTDNDNSTIAKFDIEGTKKVLQAESRGADMASYSYGELCFVIDHFYGMPGRSPLESAIRNDGLDAALDGAENGAVIKQLLKSTAMPDYIFGMDCLQMLLADGGHTSMLVDLSATQAFEDAGVPYEYESIMGRMAESYPELSMALQQHLMNTMLLSPRLVEYKGITSVRPTDGTYYKEGDTAYLLYNQFGNTNFNAWNAYYDGGCQGDLPSIDNNFLGDLAVVLDALKKAEADPEVKNLVVDLTCNPGGSLDLVLAMTALMGGQSHFYSENVLTGQRQKISYDVDSNFDGVFDQRDKEVKYHLNIGVLTSNFSFSCGNLFPSLMKDMGFPILGEKSGGGACAVQQFVTPEGLQYQISSARARLTNDKWENIDGGVEPDYVIDLSGPNPNYSALYDIASISDYFKSSGSEDGISGDMATAIAKGMYYDNDLTLDVTKTDDGSIKLYDQKRHIYTVNGAKIPEKGSDAEVNAIVDDKQKLTEVLQQAVATFAPGEQIAAYVMKSFRIDEMVNQTTGASLMPTGSTPLANLGIAMTYKGTQTVHLWDYITTGVTGSPIVIDNLEAEKHIIPHEGVTLMIGAGQNSDGSDMNTYYIDVTPDGSGTFTFDQNGIKGVITYESAPNYMADIHHGMACTYDFYKNVLGRDSYDGKGAPIYNVAFPSGLSSDAGMGGSGDDDWGDDDWNGDGFLRVPSPSNAQPGEAVGVIRPFEGQFGAQAMADYAIYLLAYGAGYNSNMQNLVVRPAGELSLISHEFTHLITRSTAHLMSSGEGGALNESFSDIMAISLMKNADYGFGPETPWVIGGNGLIAGLSSLRNMANPKNSRDGKSPAPDTYKGQYWNDNDKYGMSAVQSYFYYLLCDGGKGTNDNGTAYDVTGIGMEKGVKIAFLTLTKYCSEESDYSNIRESWLKAAQELYGASSVEAQTVAKAWTAVGIGGADPSGIEELPAAPTSDAGQWYTIDGRRLQGQPTQKGTYIYNGKKVIR